jgi:hypothetical protein
MSQQDALLVALNALQAIDEDHPYPIAKHAIEQINKALAQPEQEPVAWVRDLTSPQPHCVTSMKYLSIADTDAGVKYIPVYAAPPKREWVGLTDEEIAQVVGSPLDEVYLTDFRRVIAKLKEKNNG